MSQNSIIDGTICSPIIFKSVHTVENAIILWGFLDDFGSFRLKMLKICIILQITQ
jgi:hypothetical protein